MRHIAWLVAVGCGTQFGEEEQLVCAEVDRQPLGLDEPSPEGVVAQDVLDRIAAPYEAELQWYHLGTETGVEISVAYTGGPVAHLTMENTDEGRGLGDREESVDACEDVVAVPVETAVSTDDGQLAELWTTELRIHPDGSTYQVLDLGQPSGTFVPEEHADPDKQFDSYPRAFVHVSFYPTGVFGSGFVQVEGDGGPDGTPGRVVDGEQFPVGSWPIVHEQSSR